MRRVVKRKIVGTLLMVAAMCGIIYLYFSATFLPVWVEGEFMLLNRILRYALYVVCATVGLFGLEML